MKLAANPLNIARARRPASIESLQLAVLSSVFYYLSDDELTAKMALLNKDFHQLARAVRDEATLSSLSSLTLSETSSIASTSTRRSVVEQDARRRNDRADVMAQDETCVSSEQIEKEKKTK